MAVVKKKTNYDTLVAEWISADETLRAAKAREKELREQVVEAVFGDAPTGTNNHALPTGGTLSCVKKLNYKLDTDATLLAQGNLAGIIGADLTQRLVRWKPELSISEYNKLPADARVIIDAALTITPATPTLEFKARKS